MRALRPDEAELHREMRLRALHDAPGSFGEAYADVARRRGSYWEDQTRAVTEPGRNVMYLAHVHEQAAGMVYGLLDRARRDGGRIGGMWVEPGCRRQGIGRGLLDAVVAWCGERRLTQIGLWAPVDNDAAMAFYRAAGFRETANRGRLRDDSDLETVEMTLTLRSPVA